MSWFDDNEDYITSSLLDRRGVWSKTVEYVDVDKIVKMKCLQAGVWLSKDGPIQICQMTDSHLRNALNLVKRRNKDEVDILAAKVLQEEIDRRKQNQKEYIF